MTNYQEHTQRFTAAALLRSLIIALVAATFSVTLPAQAADKGAAHAPMDTKPAAAPRSKMTDAEKKQFVDFQKTRSEMMQTRSQLNKIQQAAFKAHPELQKQQKSFGDLLTRTMKKNGYDAKKEIAKLKSLRTSLQDKKTPQTKKRELAQQFQAKVIKLNKARSKALKDKKVSKAQHSLQKAVLTAMRKQDPNTDKLIAMLQSKQQKLLKIRQSILSHMQHAGSQPAVKNK